MRTVNRVSKRDTHKQVTDRSVVITPSLAKRIKNTNTENWIYISPRDHKWVVRKNGAERATGVYSDKATALNAARNITRLSNGMHIIVFNSQGEVSRIIYR